MSFLFRRYHYRPILKHQPWHQPGCLEELTTIESKVECIHTYPISAVLSGGFGYHSGGVTHVDTLSGALCRHRSQLPIIR